MSFQPSITSSEQLSTLLLCKLRPVVGLKLSCLGLVPGSSVTWLNGMPMFACACDRDTKQHREGLTDILAISVEKTKPKAKPGGSQSVPQILVPDT